MHALVRDLFDAGFLLFHSSLLSEETLRSSTLEQLAVIFNRNFTKVDHFRVGMALVRLNWMDTYVNLYPTLEAYCLGYMGRIYG